MRNESLFLNIRILLLTNLSCGFKSKSFFWETNSFLRTNFSFSSINFSFSWIYFPFS